MSGDKRQDADDRSDGYGAGPEVARRCLPAAHKIPTIFYVRWLGTNPSDKGYSKCVGRLGGGRAAREMR